MKTRVLVLGSSGMLGSMVLDYLSEKDLEITAPSREQLATTPYEFYDYIINCIGITKQKLNDAEEAILINSSFPYHLRKLAPKATIIQIATDCVYSGVKGNYLEYDKHDASDIYGKTKSLGEVTDDKFYNIRCSIIGFDKDNVSLLSWFLSQKEVDGFVNHYWNGITTLHFAKLCYAIISENRVLPNILHFIPKDSISKLYLLKLISKIFKKNIIVNRVETDKVHRTLSTNYRKLNDLLWLDMGYLYVPTVEAMIEELYEYNKE